MVTVYLIFIHGYLSAHSQVSAISVPYQQVAELVAGRKRAAATLLPVFELAQQSTAAPSTKNIKTSLAIFMSLLL